MFASKFSINYWFAAHCGYHARFPHTHKTNEQSSGLRSSMPDYKAEASMLPSIIMSSNANFLWWQQNYEAMNVCCIQNRCKKKMEVDHGNVFVLRFIYFFFKLSNELFRWIEFHIWKYVSHTTKHALLTSSSFALQIWSHRFNTNLPNCRIIINS